MVDPLIFVRGLHFAATLLACGTVGFIGLVLKPATKAPADFPRLRDRLTVLTWSALAVAILSGAAWLVLLAAEILGAPIVDVCLHGGAWPVLFDTRFGLFVVRAARACSVAGSADASPSDEDPSAWRRSGVDRAARIGRSRGSHAWNCRRLPSSL